MNHHSLFRTSLRWFCALCLVYGYAVNAQSLSSTSTKAIKLYKEAEEQLKNRRFDLALEIFHKALSKDPDFKEAHYQVGVLYKMYARDLNKMKYHFERYFILDTIAAAPQVVRVLGETYLHQGHYERSIYYLNKYVQNTKEPIPFLKKAEVLVKNAHWALQHKGDSVKVYRVKLPSQVNRHNKQYFPVTTADEKWLVYTIREQKGSQEYEDIYISEKKDSSWGYSESISENINTPFNNEGTCSISADGKILVFTMCGNKSRNDKDCDLYISYREGSNWGKPQNMGSKINSPYWDSQPSLSPDGKTLYFASKRPGGEGEEDLWVTKTDASGRWETPLNLGDIVNTPGREVAPYVHPSQSTLFFSSDYHPGFGSFDIFLSQKDSLGNWGVPANMGYPINTHLEESSIFISTDCNKAYYSAEFPTEKGNEHYYLYEFSLPTTIRCKEQSTYSKGKVADIETNEPLAASVELIDLATNQVLSIVKSDGVDGSYLIVLNNKRRYALFASKPGYMYESHTFDFDSISTFDPIHLDIYLQKVKKGAVLTLENIFFKSGAYLLESTSLAELQKLILFLDQNPETMVEISGHTDNVGKIQDNITLSTKRAESVVKYLLENGVSKDRIKFAGYGDKYPVAPNDTPDNKRRNRRIECKIL